MSPAITVHFHSSPHPVWIPRAGALSDRAASVSGTTDSQGRKPSGTVDLTLPDQWNYLISTFEDVDLHAVSVIAADPC